MEPPESSDEDDGEGVEKPMKEEKRVDTWKAVAAAAIAGFSAYMQRLAVPVVLLTLVMLCDYATGVGKAWMKKELCSGTGHAGIVKKVFNLALVAVGMVVDYIIRLGIVEIGIDVDMQGRFFFALLVIVWLILNELISITENCAEMGLKVPEWMKKVLKIAQKSAEPAVPGVEEKEEE